MTSQVNTAPVTTAGLSGTRVVAVLAAAVALVPLPGPWLTGALVVSLGLLPALVHQVVQLRLRLLLIACAALVVLPTLLAAIAGGNSDQAPTPSSLAFPIFLATSALVLAWAAKVLGARLALTLALPGPAIYDFFARAGQGNSWKYALSIWVVIGVLLWVSKARLPLRLVSYFALAAASALFDTRGIIGMVTVAALVDISIVLFRERHVRALLFCAGLFLAVFLIFEMSIAGGFGSAIQATMLSQTAAGPISLLAYARPELSGNIALVATDPFRLLLEQGFSSQQAAIIQESFAHVSRDPTSAYVEHNVLGLMELHSITADLWLGLGVTGLAFAICAGLFYGRVFAAVVRRGSPFAAAITFAAIRGIWDLLLSPLSDARIWPVYIVLGLTVLTRWKGKPAE